MPFKPLPKKAVPTKKTAIDPKKQARSADIVALEEEMTFRKGLVSIKDLIAPSSFEIQTNYVRIGAKFARTLFVVGYPRFINVGWFAPIINYSASFDISIFFAPLSIPLVLKQLRNKVGRTEAEISMNEEKGKPRDPVAETMLRDMEQLRDDLTQGIEHFFSVGLYVTLYGNTLQELDKLTEDMEAIFGTKLVYTKRVFYQAEQGFNSTMPLANDELAIGFNMNTAPASAAFPFISSDLTSDDGILYGINRHNNSLILFDRFSMQNANEVVFATSGAGKSVRSDTPILLKDSGGVKMTKIGEYIDGLATTKKFEMIDEELEGVIDPGVEVYTFDKDLRGQWSKVSVAARKDAPEDEYIFRLASGREISVTGDHNMLVLRKGSVVAVKSSDVLVGESIPVPTNIAEPSQPTNTLHIFSLLAHSKRIYLDGCQEFIATQYTLLKKNVIDQVYDPYLLRYAQGRRIPLFYFNKILKFLDVPVSEDLQKKIRIGSGRSRLMGTYLPYSIAITPSFMRLLGYIVSEGYVHNDFVLISNYDQIVLSDIKLALNELGISAFQRKSDGSYCIASRVLVELIKALGIMGKSAQKRVPGFAFNSSNDLVAEFLRAYFEGDGGVEKHSVTACSKSKNLISDLSYLLLRFGVCARMAVKEKKATNSPTCARGVYWFLSISGQEQLVRFKKIGFISKRKNALLNGIAFKKGNTNVFTIPVQEIFQELYTAFQPQFRGLQDVIELKNGSYQPSREKLLAVISQLKKSVLKFNALESDIRILARLPQLNEVITAGCASEENTLLWSELGQSWRLMKNHEIRPRAKNVFRACSILWGTSFNFAEVKSNVRNSFRALDLHEKPFGRSFQDALWEKDADMDYERLFSGASVAVRKYADYQRRLPLVYTLIGRLITLAESDLWWDPITSIRKIKNTDRYVYDMTVDNEVFLAGHGGLFVHNSYTIKLEVLRSMMMGVDVMIIDPEREYQHLCDAVGGTYINISLASQSRINPFDLPRAVGEQVSAADIIRSAVITLKGLLRIMLGEISAVEDSLLDRALIETYAKKDITPQCDLSKIESPTMTDLADVLEGMEGTDIIVEKLKKFTEGTFSGLINQRTNVEMRNQLVIFSVRDLEDELRPVAIYTIINYIWNVVRSEMKKRILVIDEAWWLMQHEDSAKFIFALVKRCRKYYLGVTTITQDVNDFLNSQYGRAILTNSAIQILLKQSTAAIDTIVKTFLLTDGEKYLLLESGPGEGIFFAGQKHVAIKVVASYTEDQLITTDPQQLLEIQAAKNEFAADQEAKK